jgi:hypothetical protein
MDTDLLATTVIGNRFATGPAIGNHGGKENTA